MDRLSQCPPELEALAMEVGHFIRHWGFKTIHGRIWTHLFLSEQPLDAGSMMRRLKISKALMSLSLNDLLEFQVIHEAGKSQRGTMTYIANPRVLDCIMNVLAKRERVMLEQIADANGKVKSLLSEQLKEYSLCPKKIKALTYMIEHAQSTLAGLMMLSKIDMDPWAAFNDPQKIGE